MSAESQGGGGAAAVAILALKRKYLLVYAGKPGAPENSLGQDGDWAQRRDSTLPGNSLYFKIAGVWHPVSSAAGSFRQQVWVINGALPAAQYGVSGIVYHPMAKAGHIEFQITAPIAGDYLFEIAYAMDIANAGNVSWTQTHLAVPGGGVADPDGALGGAFVNTFAPGNHTNMTGITAAVAGVAQGSTLIVRLERAAAAPDTHPGEFRFIEARYIVTP